MYEQSQSMQGMRYTTPVASVGSVLGFTFVRRDQSVLPDRNNSDTNLNWSRFS